LYPQPNGPSENPILEKSKQGKARHLAMEAGSAFLAQRVIKRGKALRQVIEPISGTSRLDYGSADRICRDAFNPATAILK